MPNNDFSILLRALLDESASISNIDGNIDTIQGKIKNIQIKAQLGNTNSITEQIAKAVNKKISINGIDINQGQINKSIQQVSKLISADAEKAISNVTSTSIGKYFKIDTSTSNQLKKEMEKLVSEWTNAKGKLTDIKISTKTSYDKESGENITKLHQALVTYKNELNEVIQKTIAWKQIGTKKEDGSAIYGFVEAAGRYSKSMETATAKTDTFIEKQQKAVASARNTLSSIKSQLNDPNITKTLAGTDFNTNGLNSQLEKVRNAISTLNTSSRDTFTQAKIDVDKEINSLNNLISTLRNAEYAATSLRTKGLGTTKEVYSSKLDVLITKMKSSGTYTKGFQNGSDNLKNILAEAVDTSGLTSFLNGLDKLEAGYKRAKASAKAYSQSQKIGINVSGLQSKIADLQRISPEIDDFKAKINNADVTVQSLYEDLTKVNTNTDLGVIKAKLKAFTEAAKSAGITVTEVAGKSTSIANQANKIQFSLETGGYESKVESLISRTRQWTNEQGNARISTEALSKAFADLNTAHDALAKNNTAANQQALINAEKELDTQIKQVTNSVRTMNAQLAKDSTISSLHNRIQEFYDKNSAAHSKWGVDLKRMLAETASGAKLTHEQVRRLSAEFNNVSIAARQAGRLGKSFTQTLREGMRSFSYWTSSTFLVMKTIQSIKKAVSTVKKLDTALVDLKKTTTMTASQLEEFYYDANDVAKQMGVTTNEIITQASAWSRLGYSSADAATKMAKYSSMFASISPGMDVDTATNGLVSIMKAFDIGNDNPDEVLDGIMSKINVIGNTAATSNKEIVNMLAKSSSAMREANNTLEQTIALETAAVEITRDDDSVGTAYKTVSMRIRGYDEETEAYTNNVEELSGKIADLTKTASTPEGISLFTDDAKTEYKSTYQLLKEISEIYSQLTDKEQARLLEALAGKRQGQILAATINNFSAAEKAMENMANSAGSADKEMNVIVDSLDYKLNRLKETWGTGIAQNLFEREDMKSLLDFLTKIGEGFDALTSKIGLFGTIGVGAGIFASVKNVGRVKCHSSYRICLL